MSAEGIKTEISGVLGECEVSLYEVLRMKKDQVFKLDRPAGDTVRVLVNGEYLAEAHVKVSEENLALKISEFVLPKVVKGNKDAEVESEEIPLNKKRVNYFAEKIPEDQVTKALQKILTTDLEQLSDVMINEHPQIIAVLLAEIANQKDYEKAAQLLKSYSDDLRAEILIRFARLREVDNYCWDASLVEISKKLKNNDTFLLLKTRQDQKGGIKEATEILGRVGEKVAKATISYTECIDKQLANSINANFVSLERLEELSDETVKKILKKIDTKTWALALKSSSEETKKKLLSNLSQDKAKELLDQMETTGAVKIKDVNSAQQKVVKRMQELRQSGELEFESDEEWIE